MSPRSEKWRALSFATSSPRRGESPNGGAPRVANGDREPMRAWLTLLRASSTLKKAADAAFRGEFGLSIARFDVLAALDRAGPDGLRAGELSQQLMVSGGNTTQVTAPLVRAGMVRRTSGPDDGRVVVFTLTQKGARLFQRMAASHRALIGGAFADFSESDLALIRRLLRRIALPQPVARKDAV